jgi:hypothetical protein
MNKEKRWDKIFREPGRRGDTRASRSRHLRAIQQDLMNNQFYDELPSKQGMKKTPVSPSKREVYNYGSIKRWVQSSVGKHVDDAISDILEKIPSKNNMIREELLRMINHRWTPAHEVHLINNIPHTLCLWGYHRGKFLPVEDAIYVHPTTGMVTRAYSLPKQKQKNKMPRSVEWNKIHYTTDIQGNWYKTVQVGTRLSSVLVDRYKVPDDNTTRGWSWANKYAQVDTPHLVTHQLNTKEKARLLAWWESKNN